MKKPYFILLTLALFFGVLRANAQIQSLSSLLSLPTNKLESVDIGLMNLLCAQGLPGADDLNVSNSLKTLDQMATRVHEETDQYFYRFQQNPSEFEDSEAFYRMIMLAVVLTEDFQVRYDPAKINPPVETNMTDGFFADEHSVFITGLTSSKRTGTCSSLPILQVAIGRRLGYPLKLVATKGHLFVRWEDAKERFNIEAAGNGVGRFSDDYYRHWPFEISDQEIKAEGYLESLTPEQELAVFLSIRGMCLKEVNQYTEAAQCFQIASKFTPSCKSYSTMAVNLERAAKTSSHSK